MGSLDDARAALAEHDRPRCGWLIGCEPRPGDPATPECPDCGEPYVGDGNGECVGCGWGPFVWCNLPSHHDEEHACVMGGGLSWDHLRAALDEADRLTAERDRLALILRCERGEWAPEGWERNDWDRDVIGYTRYVGPTGETSPCDGKSERWGQWVYRDSPKSAWTWDIDECEEGRTIETGTTPTALEAIEAANAALRNLTGA